MFLVVLVGKGVSLVNYSGSTLLVYWPNIWKGFLNDADLLNLRRTECFMYGYSSTILISGKEGVFGGFRQVAVTEL